MAHPRDVRSGYPIHPSSEIPQGFRISVPRNEWRRAILIPGNSGLPLSERYPSRVYILTPNLLTIVSHSESGTPSFTTMIADLVDISSRKEQGSGELVFTTVDQSARFRYSPIQHQCVDFFLLGLRSLWLPTTTTYRHAIAWPPDFSVWHRFVLENELDPGESMIRMLAQSRLEPNRAWPLLHRANRLETSCLALTDRRLMWFRFTEHPGTCPSSVTVLYVPREFVRAVSTKPGAFHSEQVDLEIHLKPSHRWRLSIQTKQTLSLRALLKELSCPFEDAIPHTE